MPEQILWTLNVQVAGGPKISASQTVPVEAYDKIEIEVPATSTAVSVNVLPAARADDVKLLLITAEPYDEKVTYKPAGVTGDGVALDSPQVVIGQGAVQLLEDTPAKLVFKNESTDPESNPVSVMILVGRKATT